MDCVGEDNEKLSKELEVFSIEDPNPLGIKSPFCALGGGSSYHTVLASIPLYSSASPYHLHRSLKRNYLKRTLEN